MADSFVRVPADSTGKRVDAASLDVGADTVYRQRITIADNSATAEFAAVVGGALLVSGTMNVSGTAQVAIGTPFTVNNISATVTVAGTVNVSGGVAVSGTAVVAGVVGLTAGTAVIGDINAVSRTVQVAVGTPFTLQGISTTVQVAIATPFTINNVSATVTVAGTVNVNGGVALSGTAVVAGVVGLTAGTANIGFINNISASVLVATGATADFNTLASADQIQTLPLFGIALPASGGAVAGGTNANPVSVKIENASATVTVAGVVNVNGGVAISGTAQVAIGTPFTVNNISATVVVSGLVGLTAGTANIGHLNHISQTVQVAIGTPFTVNNVSATVLAAVSGLVGLTAGAANIGFINHISQTVQVAIGTPFTVNNVSATVTVAGTVNVNGGVAISGTAVVAGVVGLTAGTAVIGDINAISRTVQVAIATPFVLQGVSATVTTQVAGFTPALMSASHGPRCVTASTSAIVTLVPSPGAGQSVHITMIACSNEGAVGSRARVGTSASASTVVMFMASAGGGFVMQFNPPWKLSASEAAVCSVKPNTSDGLFNVHYYVAP